MDALEARWFVMANVELVSFGCNNETTMVSPSNGNLVSISEYISQLGTLFLLEAIGSFQKYSLPVSSFYSLY
jgi:hypothetical protein